MKFKEIKPGMVIHCPKGEDTKVLLEHLEELGYTGVVRGNEEKNITEITEFSDLIELDEPDDSPMSATEVLEWIRHLYQSDDCNNAFPDMLDGYGISDLLEKYSSQEIVDKITAYEAAKKAPKPVEVEWVKVCRIIQIQDNGVKKCVYEEDVSNTPTDDDLKGICEEILKKYIPRHDGNYYAVVERRCRVKGE